MRTPLRRLPCAIPLLTLFACNFDDPFGTSADQEATRPSPANTSRSPSPVAMPSTPVATTNPPAACTHAVARAPSLPEAAATFELIDLGDVGFCPEDRVAVRFVAGAQVIEIPALSAAPLRFAAPIWIDAQSGQIGGSAVTLSVSGPKGRQDLAGSLRLDALVARADAASAGQTTLAVLAGSRNAVAAMRARITELVGSDNRFEERLRISQQNLELVAAAVQEAQQSGVSTRQAPLAGGEVLKMDRQTLALMDALFERFLYEQTAARSSTSVDGRLRQAQLGPIDQWFQGMVHDIATGSLESAETFAGMLGDVLVVLGGVAAVTGASPAIAALGAVTFVATTVAPAATALIMDLGTRRIFGNIDGPLDPDVWEAVAPPLEYTFEQVFGYALEEHVASFIEPTSELGSALVGLLDLNVSAEGMFQEFADWFWENDGVGNDDPDYVAPEPPDDDGQYEPPGVEPEPIDPAGGETPDGEEGEEPEPMPMPTVEEPEPEPLVFSCLRYQRCPEAGTTMEFCNDQHYDVCYVTVGGSRFDCAACTGDGLYACLDRGVAVCE